MLPNTAQLQWTHPLVPVQNLISLVVSISFVPLQIIREIDFPAYFENKFSAMELFNGAGDWKVLYSCFFKGLFTPYVHENRENRAAFPCRDVFPSTFMCVSVRFYASWHQFSCTSVMCPVYTTVFVMSVLFSVQKTAYTLQIPAQKKIHKWYQCWGVNRAHREQFFFLYPCRKADVCTWCEWGL